MPSQQNAQNQNQFPVIHHPPYDVAIIGAGVIGAALAYELSHRQLRILWLEKENDVSMGASRANTAIIHGGYDPEPGSLMARFNTKGAQRCMQLCEKLNVEYRKTGSLIIAFTQSEQAHLRKLYEQGLANKVPGMQFWTPDQIRGHEPNLSADVVEALWIPESGVINPWEFTLAMAELAVRNGVELQLNHEVMDITPDTSFTRSGYSNNTGCNGTSTHDSQSCNDPSPQIRNDAQAYQISCRNGKGSIVEFQARYVVNAAGVYSDQIHNLVAPKAFHIQAVRGEYYLLDRAAGEIVNSVIFQCPNELGKGVLVSPTIHMNTLVGPNSEPVEDREDRAVTREGLDRVARLARRSVPKLDLRYSIRNYAGIRANSDYGDFYICFAAPRFLDLAAIKSPGLTCAPAIAEYAVAQLESAGLSAPCKTIYHDGRQVHRFKDIPEIERANFVRRHPLYGRVICRCETITEGEIVDAIHREIPPVSLDGIKRRCGTGMGRCQGGFCGPKILEILARERHLKPEQILNDGTGSYILTGQTKTPACPTPCIEDEEVEADESRL